MQYKFCLAQYKTLLPFLGGGVKAIPRTALLLSKTCSSYLENIKFWSRATLRRLAGEMLLNSGVKWIVKNRSKANVPQKGRDVCLDRREVWAEHRRQTHWLHWLSALHGYYLELEWIETSPDTKKKYANHCFIWSKEWNAQGSPRNMFRKWLGISGNAWSFLNCLGFCRKFIT